MAFIDEISYNRDLLDAFYRLRISNPATLFDSKFVGDDGPLFWDDAEVSGGGTSTTYNTNQASVTLAVGNLTAGKRVRQTFRRFNYQPGKSQLAVLTGVLGGLVSGVTKCLGLYDDENGFYFDNNGTNYGVNIRSFVTGAAVDTRIEQASWNIDTMDGNGPSGVTLDFTKTQIFFLDFEWLGVGSIRYGFFINGTPIYCHQIDNANIGTTVYMSTPNLPLRYEIENDGTGAADDMLQICSTVISEGGQQETGLTFGVSRGADSLVTLSNTNLYPLISIRLKSGFLGSTVKVKNLSLVCTSTAAYNYYLLLNPTVAGVALSFSDVVGSSIEADATAENTTTVSGGTVLYTGVGQSGSFGIGSATEVTLNDFALGSAIDGTADTLVLAVQRVTGTTETFYAGLNIIDQK